jgi:hypothetical protein
MAEDGAPPDGKQRGTRRAERLRAERERIRKHGASIRRVYRDAVLKRKRKSQG